MKIIEPGHVYQLQHQDGTGAGLLVFVNREAGTEHEGTQTQEVLRALIDRTQHCDSCLRWDGNDKIIEHLRMALVLHEARALERKTAKGEIAPEAVAVGPDGHFVTQHHRYDTVMGRVIPVTIPASERRMVARALMQNEERQAVAFGEPKTSDHCRRCGDSPDSGRHLMGPGAHEYEDPRLPAKTESVSMGARLPPYRCNVPMCGESGLCDQCRPVKGPR